MQCGPRDSDHPGYYCSADDSSLLSTFENCLEPVPLRRARSLNESCCLEGGPIGEGFSTAKEVALFTDTLRRSIAGGRFRSANDTNVVGRRRVQSGNR